MPLPYKTNRKPITLIISVVTDRPQKVVIRVWDARKPQTYYEDRYATVNGKDNFYVKMPTSPEIAMVDVLGAKFNITETKLVHTLIPARVNNFGLQNFIKFAQEFSEDAAIISAGFGNRPNSIYKSDDGKFRIDYYNVMYDMQRVIKLPNGQVVMNQHYGQPVTTPMRTDAQTGVIEVSKHYIVNYTVPMRMAILLHEYSHFYVNNNPADETEADLNALLIFLSLGYGKIAAYKAFVEVFKNADTPGNRERDRIIKNFIDNFDSMQFRLIA